MWPFNKKDKTKNSEEGNDQFIWLAVGDGNPFDAPVMDIRAFTLNVVATTPDKSVAENYTRSRKSNGQEFIGKEPRSPVSLKTEITYPHNGAELEGVVFKSTAMEIKWDIYAYGEWFYFVRSWTSDLVYKVKYTNTGNSLVLTQVIAADQCSEETAQDIHSIMLTHPLGRVWPFHVPEHMQDSDGKSIALYMFSQFGAKATVVTNENVVKIQLVK
jgi:hypothetical protein